MRYDAEKARERNEIGARLTEARRALRMTQGELAAALGLRGVRVQTAAVSKWEKGDSVPNAYQLAAACDALGMALFGPEERLWEYLRVRPGAISPLGLLFDEKNVVQLLIDEALLDEPTLGFHPNDNAATVVLSGEDFFRKFLPSVHREYRTVRFP